MSASSDLPCRAAAFFDRDGVLNIDKGYVHRVEDFELVPGAIEAVAACRADGLRIFVVTNQSGIARGLYPPEEVDRLHAHMAALFAAGGAPIDAIRYCPHHPAGTLPDYARTCNCRKPAAGMLESLMVQFPTDRTRSLLVGDKASDLAAASAAGIAGYLYSGGDLAAFVEPLLVARAHRTSAC